MAEIAVPLIALGSMYVISKQKKNSKVESYTNMTNTRNELPGINPPRPVVNFPLTENVKTSNNTSAYVNENQHTDKYFDKTNYASHEQRQTSDYGVGGGNKTTFSLTGSPIDKSKFKHQNMIPFFGGKVRGATINNNIAESVLDNMQGQGSQFVTKKEQAPMFKPQEGYQFANGSPNVSDFIQSRVNPSMKISNVKPWDEQRVAPGLNQGYNNNGSAGYNSGMEARDMWIDKNVDELRVATNPKMSYDLIGHEGPSSHYIKNAPTTMTQGKVEKHLPDKYYASGPERWMTTTGIEKAPTARGIELLHDVNRTDTTAEYYGSRANQTGGTYVNREYQPTRRPVLAAQDLATPSYVGSSKPTTGDYGAQSYSNLANNRSTTRNNNIGPAGGFIKAIVSPILDILRPTRKQDVIDNMRSSGNAGTSVSNGQIFNPADRTKTTIREMTESELDCNHMNVQSQKANAYLVTQHQPVDLQRDTTNVSYTGTAGSNGFNATKSYEAEYKQRNNVNKTHVNRPNQGGTQMFNQNDNISISKRDADRDNNRLWVPSSVGNTSNIPSRAMNDNIGRVKVSESYDQNINTDRIAPELLNAFKNNPYTQSLTSWA